MGIDVTRNSSIRALAFAVLACCLAAPAVGADPFDLRFLEGLRQRQLYELAEQHCRRRLADLPASEVARAELTLELIRTFSLQAANAPPAEREGLWQAARKVAADYLEPPGSQPRAMQVRFQDALTPLAQGELGRQEFEVGALAAPQAEEVNALLREAANLLESLDSELTRDIPLRRRTTPRAGDLSADQLFALQEHVQHQLARAQRNRALMFVAGSDDRLALLLAASSTLQRPLSRLRPDDPRAAAIQLDLAECHRLLGKYDEAGALCTPLTAEGIAPATRLRARAELLRVAIAQGQPATVQRLLEEGRLVDGESGAELDFAWFEALLSLARSASAGERLANPDKLTPASLAKRYADQAAQTADFLEATYGPYWGRRADQLLVASLPRGMALVNADLLARTADSLYGKGEFDAALAAYDEAATAARAKNDLKAAFELGYKAALLEQNRRQYSSASTRLRILSKSLATHEQAPAAHLLAAWNAAQLARADAAAATNYASILREHLATFPGADSANQARRWLGKLHESQEDWDEAIEAYTGITAGSEHFPWAALSASKLILRWQPEGAAEAENLLQIALKESSDPAADWRLAAKTQLVVALAAQPGREDEALAVVQELGEASSTHLLAVLESLSQVADRATDQQRLPIAKVQLALAAALAPARSELSAAAQASLDQIQAAALAAAGQREQALAAYATLAQANPKSAGIQQRYAQLLLDSADPVNLRAALDRWRHLASRTKPRTAEWHEAKHGIALAQIKLGDKAGAADLLRYVLNTPPGLRGTKWESQYLQLLQQCEN